MTNSLSSSCTVVKVEAFGVAIPLKKPMRMAGVRITHAENLIVRIETNTGIVGWGESASAPTMTGDLVTGMVCAVEKLFAPLVLGRSLSDRNIIMYDIDRAAIRNTGAKCAVDCALYDALGKAVGLPVYELLGGLKRKELRPMFLLGNDKIEDDLIEAKQKMADGIRFFKIKIGVKSVSDEIKSTKKLREILGPEVSICADGNMGLNSEGILQYVKGVENENLLFLEQPLRNENLQGMAVVASKIGVPICADESVGSSADIMALRRSRAASGVNLKIIKFGGISQVVHASHICQEIGFSINLACKVAESSIAAAAISNLGFVLSNLDWGISMTNHYLSDDLVNTPIFPANGVISVNSIPGLGVDVDEAKIRRYKI